MSIINDALKKAQKAKGKTTTGSNSTNTQPESNPTNQDVDKKGDSASKSFDLQKLHLPKPVIIVIAVIVGLFLINKLIFKPKKIIYISKDDIVKLKESEPQEKAKAAKPQAASAQPTAPAAKPQPVSQPKPAPEIAHEETVLIKPSQMRITGVVTGSGEPFAIINDKIYREGDSIGTAKIVKISDNKITFDYNGLNITFTVNR